MNFIPAHLFALCGAALGTPWVAFQEARILSQGHPLSKELLVWSRENGIPNPHAIRLLRQNPIPLPAPLFIRKWLDPRGFPCLHLAGLCLRHGIYLAPNLPHENSVLRHELIHTRQYHEAGSIFAFLRRYLFQCLTQGYAHCDMEREANGKF